ncbi:MAG: DnaA regulatory inactivator Hda, partial [Kangiellaceae bacterium]|nr:DnaA regulatory inactivator Hda [Kangiellaceae bacterium]
PPLDLNIDLQDLTSRLSAMTVFKVHSISDNEKQVLLQQKAASKGIELAADVAQFMLTRNSRDLRCLMNNLDKLDSESLVQQRKLTVPFVKKVLEI